jgi:hypothetical protein
MVDAMAIALTAHLITGIVMGAGITVMIMCMVANLEVIVEAEKWTKKISLSRHLQRASTEALLLCRYSPLFPAIFQKAAW